MWKNFKFVYNRLNEKLWFRPLIFCVLSIGAAFLASLADGLNLGSWLPSIDKDSLKDLLSTLSDSMLVIAIFAVASMLSAFSAAGNSATPRSFRLIASDDLSQTALSVYIGAFIFSIVSGISLKNGFYGDEGVFTLFVLTLLVFALVILTFLRWVERISKLGRLDHTVEKVEKATHDAFTFRIRHPLMGASPIADREWQQNIYAERVGYVQTIDFETLQAAAIEHNNIIRLNCLPGSFVTPDKPIAFLQYVLNDRSKLDLIRGAVAVGRTRVYEEDPRFGLIALSEIASRALSPGINDPGTAIAIIGTHVRLFAAAASIPPGEIDQKVKYNRVQAAPLLMEDLFEDAFRPIARDGAGNVEVMIRLQKAFRTLAMQPNEKMKSMAVLYSQACYERAAEAIDFEPDLRQLKALKMTAGSKKH